VEVDLAGGNGQPQVVGSTLIEQEPKKKGLLGKKQEQVGSN
jgi:hypothetical protein